MRQNLTKTKHAPRHRLNLLQRYWFPRSMWLKLPTYILLVFAFLLSCLYGVAVWYQHQHRDEPLQLGTTFIAPYAESYGLEPHHTLQMILGDLGVRNIRLVSYWEDIEKTPGQYDFSGLDWQIAMAQQYGAKVTLAIGLRQPRWPECHAPNWVNPAQPAVWQPELNQFMGAVINHYKANPTIINWQLENEYFLSVFGECQQFGDSRERLINEYNFVKDQDPSRPIILSLADNYTFPFRGPVPDYYGMSIYKRIFEFTVTKRNFEYPFPPWYYSGRAGLMQIIHGSPSIMHELQAEPWGPKPITQMTLAEQDETMNADLLAKRFKYAEDTGLRTIYAWGAEWWLWRMEKMNDPSLWNVAKQAVAQANAGEH